jgi:hypothetical protein
MEILHTVVWVLHTSCLSPSTVNLVSTTLSFRKIFVKSVESEKWLHVHSTSWRQAINTGISEVHHELKYSRTCVVPDIYICIRGNFWSHHFLLVMYWCLPGHHLWMYLNFVDRDLLHISTFRCGWYYTSRFLLYGTTYVIQFNFPPFICIFLCLAFFILFSHLDRSSYVCIFLGMWVNKQCFHLIKISFDNFLQASTSRWTIVISVSEFFYQQNISCMWWAHMVLHSDSCNLVLIDVNWYVNISGKRRSYPSKGWWKQSAWALTRSFSTNHQAMDIAICSAQRLSQC